MKIMAQMAVIGALVAGATALNAQTNIDVNVNISLNGVIQTGDTATKGRISTKDVIQAVAPGASAKAKLVSRTVVGGGGGFVVRDGTTDTVIDGGVLSADQVGDAVTVTTDKNGVTTEKSVAILRFVLNTDTLGFDVQGYATSSSSNKGLLRGEVFEDTSLVSASAKVSGSIRNSTGNGVAQGTVSASGRKITEIEIP